MRFIDREEVAKRLTYDLCIPIVRDAMIAFSRGETKQLSAFDYPAVRRPTFRRHARCDGRACPVRREVDQRLPRELLSWNTVTSRPRHPVRSGDPARRFAWSMREKSRRSARPRPVPWLPTRWPAKTQRRLALLGYGEQAATHARAIGKVRNLDSIVVWGRSARARAGFRGAHAIGTWITGDRRRDVKEAVAEADIVCTVTSAVRADPGRRMGAAGDALEFSRLELRRACGS